MSLWEDLAKGLGGAFTLPIGGVGLIADAVGGAAGGGGSGQGGNVDEQLKALEALARKQGSSNSKTTKRLAPELEQFNRDADSAYGADSAAYEQQTGLSGQMGSLYDDLVAEQHENQRRANAKNKGALGDYMGATDPLLAQLKAGGYVGDAKSNAADVARQQGVFNQLQTLSNPQVTGQERYLMELARGQQEQQERSSRDAVMGDLAARGMSGSGAQLTNMLGASQQNSQNRLLADLGTQANAIGRSTNAIGMAGDVAGQMQNSSDVMARANQQLSQLQTNFMSNFGQSEAERVAGLAGERRDAEDSTAEDVYRRQQEGLGTREGAGRAKYDLGMADADALRGIYDNKFSRQGDVFGATGGYVNQVTDGRRQDYGMVADAMGKRAGNTAAENAAKALEPKGAQKLLPWNW